jgi:quercetin dioxygenase-like cupin family protein
MRAEHAEDAVAGYVLGAGEGVGGAADVKASRVSTGGALTLIESRTTGGAPRHVHSHEDEAFYVLEGTISVECGAERWEAGPRAFVFLPRGVPHAWDVVGDEATVLILTAPAGLEEFLGEYHAASGSARDEVAAKHGIEFLHG